MTSPRELSALLPAQAGASAPRSDHIHVRWVMPEVFHDLPVNCADDDEAVRLLEDLVDRVLPGADEEDKTWFGAMCALEVDGLTAIGAEYAAIGFIATEGVPCTATTLVSLIESPDAAGADDAVKAIASSLRRSGAGDVSEIELPCGPAVSCIGTRNPRLMSDQSMESVETALPTWYIQVYVPLPNDSTVIMEMSTMSSAGWDIFSTMFGNTVSSLRLFTPDGSPLITSEVSA